MKLDNMSNQEAGAKLMEVDENSKNAPPVVEIYPLWFSKRFVILILVFAGYFFSIGIKISINIIAIEMTSNKTLHIGNETIYKSAEYEWNSKIIGLVQGCFNYMYALAIVGGYLATKFGGSVTYGVATAVESVLTILNPLCLQLGGLYGFLACRMVVGFFDGMAYASTAEIYSRWVPFSERSKFMAIIFCGVYIAAAVSYPLFGYIAYYYGWRMIFYITGSTALIWSIVWLIVARNEPSADRFISKKELSYISSTAETAPRNEIVHPYREMLLSPATWAMCLAKLAYYWGFSMILAFVPFYVKDVTQGEVDKVGLISSIPNVACIFVTPVIGAFMDYLQNNTALTPNKIHKMLMTFGFVTSSVLFVALAFNTNFTISMACFVLIKLFLSFNFLILQMICLYMAPKHAGILLGLSAFWWLISQIILPTTVGFIIVNHSLQEWSICFLLSAGVLMFGAIVYLVYGSSELQPWAD